MSKDEERRERIDLVARVTKMLRDPKATKRIRQHVQEGCQQIAQEQEKHG